MINLSIADADNILRPRITVMGVGGAGCNAVNNMIRAQLEGCDFVSANTDAQSLQNSLAPRKIQLGINQTRGLGAGSKPDMGRAAAEEQINDIMACLEQTDMVFITAGMGGGTGTGAAPVIARLGREAGILTVGVVTRPFDFEGNRRRTLAEQGLAELQHYVDTLIIIPNQNLFRLANERTTFAEAFRMADEVLHCGVRGITDLMVMPGFMNLDFADVKTVMSEMGKAMMGTGEASGENRALRAAESAISNPLLEDTSMKGARGVLINITGGMDMTLFEVDQAANRIRDEVDPDAQIKVGSTLSDNLEGTIRVSVIATGIDAAIAGQGAAQGAAGASAFGGAPVFKPLNLQKPPMPPQSMTPPAAAQNQAAAAGSYAPANPPPPRISEAPREAASPFFGGSNYNTGHGAVEAAMPQQQNAANPAQPPSFASRFQQQSPQQPQHTAPPAALASATPPADPAAQQMMASHEMQPAPRSAPAPATAPLRGEQADGHFIAPRPIEAPRQPQMAQPHTQPAAAAAPAARFAPQQPRSQAAAPQDESALDPKNTRRAESLFTRITGFGLVRPSTDSRPGGAPPSVQQRLNIDPNAAQATANEEEEDLLEIPAFLRRQTNH